MSYTTSPVNGVRVPDKNEKLADIWKAEGVLAHDLETRVNMRFANMADLVAKLTGDFTPVGGEIAYIADVGQYLGYVKGAWKRLYPSTPQIFSGTSVPPANLGSVGDIYLLV